MDMSIHVDVREAKDLVASVKDQTRQYVAIFEEARVFLETAFTANFASRGGEVGGWAPYGSWSAEAGQPAALVRTGRLMESLMTLRGVPNEITPTSATFGTNVPYAKFHQGGTTQMPKREIVFEPAGFAEFLAERVADHMVTDYAQFRSMLP